jgi:hypothetical protein
MIKHSRGSLLLCLLVAGRAAASADAFERLVDAAARQAPAVARRVNFYKNSRRRAPTAAERKPIVRISTKLLNCAGFFVKNQADEFLIATARHCALYRFEKACKDNDIEVVTAAGSFLGRCESVIAEGRNDDMVVFKARFTAPKKKLLTFIDFLALSAVPAPQGMPLTVIGYPADRYSNGSLTLTENCWANNGTTADSLLTSEERLATQKAADRTRKYFQSKGEDYDAYVGFHKFFSTHSQLQAHNCTTYQGNSGGPFLWSGHPIAFGMPAGSHPDVYREFPETASNNFTTTAGFVRGNRQALERAGVALVDVLPLN